MSEYKNFTKDFPTRCSQVLEIFYEQAKNLSNCSEVNDGREITLLIMTASAGFIFPYERLRPRENGREHIANDKEKYPVAAKSVKNLLNKKFINSKIFKNSEKTWIYGKFKKNNRESINDWREVFEGKHLDENLQAIAIINTIRNALAHGSIYTLNESENQIDTIIFISEIKNSPDEYKFVKVSTEDFKKFLKEWFNFLQKPKEDILSIAQTLDEFVEKDK